MEFSRRTTIAVVVLLLFSAWVTAAALLDWGQQSDGPCEVKCDPCTTFCPVEERPVDLRIDNLRINAHNVTVQVANGSGELYAETVEVDGQAERVLDDVIDTPGEYRIRARLDTEEKDSLTVQVDDRYIAESTPIIRIGVARLVVDTPTTSRQ